MINFADEVKTFKKPQISNSKKSLLLGKAINNKLFLFKFLSNKQKTEEIIFILNDKQKILKITFLQTNYLHIVTFHYD